MPSISSVARCICFVGIAVVSAAFRTQAQTSTRRPLSELINQQEPGWELVSQWIREAKNKVQVLPKTPARADSTLLAAQVTTRSPMGAIMYETGGILVDNGWIRILGSGSPTMQRTLANWNKDKLPGMLLVADDVLGGFYALNGGAFGPETLGSIFYFAPESLQWQATNKTYSEFLVFCFSGDLKKYYHDLRWKGWEQEVTKLTGDEGLACYPFLFTKEGKAIAKDTRGVVPVAELWVFGQDMKRQLEGK